MATSILPFFFCSCPFTLGHKAKNLTLNCAMVARLFYSAILHFLPSKKALSYNPLRPLPGVYERTSSPRSGHSYMTTI